MSRPGRLASILAMASLLSSNGSADDLPARPGGFSPEEAAARMIVPEGFRVEVFAAEPDIRQPVAAHFDDRGRLWVIEYLQYPHPAGLKPLTADVYLRTEYDRVPEPPPHGPRGVDRIKILEDTNGDGRADRVTTFVEGLNIASGLAVGHGGVFVAQAPYLLFYPDRDRDDMPDGDPEVLLTGFGLEDTHAVVNSLAWGPDGWLYGAQGSTCTAKVRGYEFQQGIWRYHPVTKEFELFAEGGGNTWGLDFDRLGHAFGSSNGGFVAFHMVQGGYYWKGFAKHGPLHNPRTFGYFDALPYDGRKHGGHVTPGGILYKGDQFPESFQNRFIGGNLLSNAVYWHELAPEGSTFRASHGGTLIDARDAWFRPIDLLTGPDGCLYVIDWYDRRASHLDPRDNWDKSNGRIYRVVHGDRPRVEPFDLSTWPTDRLLDLRNHPNDWWPETARRILYERQDASAIPGLRASLDAERDEARALLDLWALNACGGLDRDTSLTLLDHPVPSIRRWVVRFLGDHREIDDTTRDRFARLVREESDPAVRSQLASTLTRLDPGVSLDLLGIWLTLENADTSDPHLPLLLWWAVERAMREQPEATYKVLTARLTEVRPILRNHLLERYARALAAEADPEELRRAADLLATAGNLEEDSHHAGLTELVVNGLEKGLEGRQLADVPPELGRELARMADRGGLGLTALRLAARLGDMDARRRVLERIADLSAPESDRLALIELAGQLAQHEDAVILLTLLDASQPTSIRQAAIDALGSFADPAVAGDLMARLPNLTPPLRSRAIDRLIARKDSAARLLDAMADGRVEPNELKATQAATIARLGDPALSDRLAEIWGNVPGPGSEAMIRRIAEVRGVLPEGDKGDPARGVAVFQQQCAGCHNLFGDGEAIGPELTGAERGNLDFLLESLVDPSAVIRKEYQGQAVATTDGRVLVGLVVEESEAAITLFDSERRRTVIPRDQIEELAPSAVSVMPEGLLDLLSNDQIRDLFRYLQSSGPPS